MFSRWFKRCFIVSMLLFLVAACTLAEQDSEAVTAIVNTKSSPLSMRAEPKQNGKTILEIKKGEIVTIIANGEWPLVEYAGKQGYVNGQYLQYNESKKSLYLKAIADQQHNLFSDAYEAFCALGDYEDAQERVAAMNRARLLPMLHRLKFGLIDTNGEWAVEPQWDYIEHMYYLGSNTYAYSVYSGTIKRSGGFITNLVSGKWGLIGIDGKELIPCVWERIIVGPNGYVACFSADKKGSLYYFDGNAMQLLADDCTGIDFPYEGLFAYEKNGQWSFASIDNAQLWEGNAYDEVGRFSCGLATVKINGKYGFIDHTGKVVLTPQWDNCKVFNSNLCPASIEGKWGYIDLNGEWAIQPQYSNADSFSDNGVAVVEKDNQFLLIDTAGRQVGSTYASIEIVDETGSYLIKKNGKWGLMNSSGKILIDATHQNLIYFGDNTYLSVDSAYQLWDKNGNKLGTLNAAYAKKHNFSQMQIFQRKGSLWHGHCVFYADGNLIISDPNGTIQFDERAYKR